VEGSTPVFFRLATRMKPWPWIIFIFCAISIGPIAVFAQRFSPSADEIILLIFGVVFLSLIAWERRLRGRR